MDIRTIGKRVRERRAALKWTQQELADTTGIGRSYIASIETGQQANITVATINKLAVALNCTPQYLTGDTPDETAAQEIEPALSQYAREANLSADEMLALARIEYRGARPSTVPEWRELHRVLKKFSRRRK